MKVLHVASFVGNIGDNASHIGFRKLLSSVIDDRTCLDFERLEIRRFYKNYKLNDKLVFDQSFLDYANDFDLLIIGGGGFLDYWVNSSSGTTIDMSPELVANINVPTIIYSVGCMPHKEIPAGNLDKFRLFLDALMSNPKIRVAVRNDGSILTLKNEVGFSNNNKIKEVLDNGFFFDTESKFDLGIEGDYVAINVTNDQLEMNSKCRPAVDKLDYLNSMRTVVDYLTRQQKRKVVFVPHILSDLAAINNIIEGIDDFIARNFITVAPCVQHDSGANIIFSIYKNSSLVIGSRFHANVCSLAMTKPTLALVALDRVKYVFDQMKLDKNYVIINGDFSSELIDKIIKIENAGSVELVESYLFDNRKKSTMALKSILYDLCVIKTNDA